MCVWIRENAYVQLFVLYYKANVFWRFFSISRKKNFNWNSFGNSVESVCFGLNESNIAKQSRKKQHSYKIFAQFDGAKVFLCAFYCIMESTNNLSEMIFIVCSFVWSGTHKTMRWTNGHFLCFFSRTNFFTLIRFTAIYFRIFVIKAPDFDCTES